MPVNCHYDGQRLLVRLADHPGSEKVAFADATETATLVVCGNHDPDSSWSVVRQRVLADVLPRPANADRAYGLGEVITGYATSNIVFPSHNR